MISVLTLVHGRSNHLDNVVAGLEAGRVKPDELVIVHMNELAKPRRSETFPVVTVEIANPSTLPLAAARNLAAASAKNDRLVFLDVDCIPDPFLVSEYQSVLAEKPAALHQGDVRYLPAGFDAANASASDLRAAAQDHPLKAYRDIDGHVPYDLFWSLNFACTKQIFDEISGFDERYTGYGGEDTDLSYRARDVGVPIFASRACAFHQYHPSYEPPLNHLSDIVRNAKVFKKRWGVWPMLGWLSEFEKLGYIHVRPDEIEVVKVPTRDEIARCLSGME